MTDTQITNVHVHAFTRRHIPRDYPNWLVARLQGVPALPWLIAVFSRFLGWFEFAEKMDRLIRFKREADKTRQSDIIDAVMKHYPGDTRFVVLPMDMEPLGYGRVERDIRAQHEELADLAAQPR